MLIQYLHYNILFGELRIIIVSNFNCTARVVLTPRRSKEAGVTREKSFENNIVQGKSHYCTHFIIETIEEIRCLHEIILKS